MNIFYLLTRGDSFFFVLENLLTQKQGKEQFVLLQQGSYHIFKEDFRKGGLDVLGPLNLVRVLGWLRGLFHGNVIQFGVEIQRKLIHWLDVGQHHH